MPDTGEQRVTRACSADLPLDVLEPTEDGHRLRDGDAAANDWLRARLREPPAHRVAGRPTTQERALDAAAALLRAARAPLVLGLGRASVETARAAVALADRLGAVVDPSGGHVDGAGGRASALRGASTATLGDVAEHAEGVVVWREDPERSHPGLLARLGLADPDARAAAGRRLVVVDDRETASATAALADRVVALPAGRDHDALRALLAIERGVAVDERLGLPVAALVELLGVLGGSQYGAVLHGAGLAGGIDPDDDAAGDGPHRTAGGHRPVVALHALTRALNARTHAVSLALRRDPGAQGAEDVLAWQTGLAGAVDLGSGAPSAEPGVTDAATLLTLGAVDAALVVADDPARYLPSAALRGLGAVPTVVVTDLDRGTGGADVVLATATPGLGAAGVLHRFDGVPVPAQAPVPTELPTAESVLGRLHERLVLAEGPRERSA